MGQESQHLAMLNTEKISIKAVAFKDSSLNKGTALTSLKRDLDLTMFVSSSDWPKLLEADHLACYSEDSCGSINSLLVLKKFLINKLSCKKLDFE